MAIPYDNDIQPSGWSKIRRVFVILLLLGTATTAATEEIFRYTDAKGRAVFTDRALSNPHYRLVWRSSISKIDATFQHPPHRPIGSRRSRRWRHKSELTPLIKRVARRARLSADLLHAVVQAESAYNPEARSTAGAMGLMQLMPATARRYGVTDVWDPAQNLTGGASYLRDLLDLFKNDLRLALAAYNAGEGAVIKNGNHIPPYPETQEYVRRVINNFRSQRQESKS